MIRLGINVDHIATVRNARGETYPDPVQAAVFAELGGADNITCHLREDRRHIRDRDVRMLKNTIKVPLNFEMAATDEMVAMACEVRPHYATLVPEKRAELTTEGGMDIAAQKDHMNEVVAKLRDQGILVSMFIEPEQEAIDLTVELGAEAVEIHTGEFCRRIDAARSTQEKMALVGELDSAAVYAHECGLQVHFGHGLHYGNAQWLQLVSHAEEANIGHAVVARALFVGLEKAVREMKALLNDPQNQPYFA